MENAKSLTLANIATHLGATLRGDPDTLISGMATLESAGMGDLSFLANPAYARFLPQTQASAVILHPAQLDACPVAALVTPQPYVAYARASSLFARHRFASANIHPTAIIAADAKIGEGAMIGPLAVIGEGVVLGERVRIAAGTRIGAGCRIGDDAILYPNVVMYDDCEAGDRLIVHAGAVIGADGFGFAPSADGFVKIEQLGRVVIGNDVEIGANTTIDRGALGDTRIGDGVKLDNQIQIAHNVVIGSHTVVAACAGISGSSRVGSRCMVGGGVGIAGHLEIGNDVHLTGMTLVTHDIPEAGVYSSGTAVEPNRSWRKNVARFRQLDHWIRKLRDLEKRLS